ncbi:MAG: nucleoside deaminase [Lactobacillales bacterium]|nr:nucleoside deaminase [Lactobacillales bacterium]
MNDEKYIEIAYKEALKAYKKGDTPIGCVIVKNNKIIAKAYNKKEKNNIATHHAELLAINKACKKLKTWHLDDCTLYSTMEPCIMCSGAIIQSRIKKIVYSMSNNSFGNIENNEYFKKNKYEIVKIDNKEILELVQKFFKKLR